jgi:VanZ family protein
MFKPAHFVIAARSCLALGLGAVLVLTLGPFQGLEQVFGLNDKAAHILAFSGLTAIAFLAVPRRRRGDIVRALIFLGGAIEMIQAIEGRDASFLDWVADAVGVYGIYGAGMIEVVRQQARERSRMTFSRVSANDRRGPRRERRRVKRTNGDTVAASGDAVARV